MDEELTKLKVQRMYVAPSGYSAFYPHAKPGAMVSAAEIRSLGLKLGDEIPDHAHAPKASVWFKIVPKANFEERSFGMEVEYIFLDAFSWVNLEVAVEAKSG